MNVLPSITILVTAFLVVFFQAAFHSFRYLVGVQIDLLPSLIVYASLTAGLWTLCLTSVLSGLWVDSLSANPLGISVLPLFLIGFAVQHYKGLILRDQLFAQCVLGAAASAVAPALTVVLLFSAEMKPLIGWFTLWQWLVMIVGGAVATPVWFRLLDVIIHSLSYKAWAETTYRGDREIKRGRS